MMRARSGKIWIFIALVGGSLGLSTGARATDDTARFYGTWETTVPYNGQTVIIVSVHDASGYKNYTKSPSGNTPAGDGTFFAANGKYTTSADKPNDSGTYHFLGDNIVVCTNAAGQTVTWKRDKKPVPAPTTSAPPNGRADAEPAAAPPAALAPDPSLPSETNAAIAAFNNKDNKTAWRDFMAAAQKGDSEAEAGVGAMLFQKINPPGTGFYAQCEKWLLASANQGNVKGMDFLAQYYYATGAAISGGNTPGINNGPIPLALRKQAEDRFALARQWFERWLRHGKFSESARRGCRGPTRSGSRRSASRRGFEPHRR